MPNLATGELGQRTEDAKQAAGAPERVEANTSDGRPAVEVAAENTLGAKRVRAAGAQTSDARAAGLGPRAGKFAEAICGLPAYLASGPGWRVQRDLFPARRGHDIRLPGRGGLRREYRGTAAVLPMEPRDSPDVREPHADLKSCAQPLD